MVHRDREGTSQPRCEIEAAVLHSVATLLPHRTSAAFAHRMHTTPGESVISPCRIDRIVTGMWETVAYDQCSDSANADDRL